MISRQLAKFVKSLKLKKYRKKASAFVVEGAKNVVELLSSDFEVLHLFITEKFINEYQNSLPTSKEYTLCPEKDLQNLGTFQSNEYALAVAKMKDTALQALEGDLVIALDNVQDPGNLGTIIRIADWYGIGQILASHETADIYNPKVINASMGSFTRVSIHYTDLEDKLPGSNRTVYGAFLEGINVHEIKSEIPAIVLLGNESSGISNKLMKSIDRKITIPRVGGAESLNVAVSTAIICDNLIRSKK
jgi:TrmH family RNA methyltransferase